MNKSIEQTIKRIKRFSLSCTLNDNGTTRHFHNGHEYVEIGGIKWATCNVGAEKPTDSGLYFAWGETQGFTAKQVMNYEKWFGWGDYKYGSRGNLTYYNNTDKKTTLEPQDDAATFNMGDGWRTPTMEEFVALFDSTTSKWVENYQGSGVNGRLFTDKKDKTKQLFFPTVGYCYNGSISCVRYYSYYWSSSLSSSSVFFARYLYFSNSSMYWKCNNFRCVGLTMRGVVR